MHKLKTITLHDINLSTNSQQSTKWHL